MPEMSKTAQLITPDIAREIERVYCETMDEYTNKFAAELTPILVGRLSQLFSGISWSVAPDLTDPLRTVITIKLGDWKRL